MTTRLWWMLALSVGLAACTGGPGDTADKNGDDDDDDVAGDDDDDDDTDVQTGETGDDPGGFFDVRTFLVNAQFGFNTTTGIVNPTASYGEAISGIILHLGSPSWAGSPDDTANYCIIILPVFESGPSPAWVAANQLFYGVDFDPTVEPFTSCTAEFGFALDPADWGYPPGFGYETVPWGVGIGNLLPEFEADYAGGDFEDFVAGGWIENVVLPAPNGLSGYTAFARQLDDQNNILLDAQNAPILVPADEIPVAGLPAPLAQAQYLVFSRFIWEFVEE